MHEYSYAKDAFRHASLIAELTAQLCFTQARLRAPSWRAMRSPHGGGETRRKLLSVCLRAGPFYLAYLVSFLTIGAAWLALPSSRTVSSRSTESSSV